MLLIWIPTNWPTIRLEGLFTQGLKEDQSGIGRANTSASAASAVPSNQLPLANHKILTEILASNQADEPDAVMSLKQQTKTSRELSVCAVSLDT
jgi:hypothetical protein